VKETAGVDSGIDGVQRVGVPSEAPRSQAAEGGCGIVQNLPDLDAVVIGAGVVGLAIARTLARAGRQVVVLEAEDRIGSHSSSRNSEVIHAGIYYPSGTLKARLCVEGKAALYKYCESKGIAHSRLGKLIVATRDEEVGVLENLKLQAESNGVDDLRWLDRQEAHDLEPEVVCVRALLSPSTGIVDSHGLLTALCRDAKDAGAEVVLSSPVSSGRARSDGILLSGGTAESYRVLCQTVVNAAGLSAQSLARAIEGLPANTVPPAFLAKGHYFAFTGRSPFSRLIYPVPQPGGLGIHLTLDLAGRARFGPDVLWVDRVDYQFEEGRQRAFVDAIRQYFPKLNAQSIEPDYTGIRPKLGPAGSPSQDFVVQGPETHGVRGLVNLYGIESPGLTAALALAELVYAMVGQTE
jgi:L-2-hydroxyglutarate oxidase LhgO